MTAEAEARSSWPPLHVCVWPRSFSSLTPQVEKEEDLQGGGILPP